MKSSSFRVVKENFNSWTGKLGILLTTLTIYSVFVNLFNLTVPEIVFKCLQGYRTIFHFPFYFLENIFTIKIEPFIKDLFVLWTIAAGATVRANNLTRNNVDYKAKFTFLQSVGNSEWRRKNTYSNFRISIILNFYHWAWRYVIVFFTWPRVLYVLFKNTPYLMKYEGQGEYKRNFVYVNEKLIQNYEAEQYKRYRDLRKVFAGQLLYAIAAALFLIFVFSLES